jgi:polysaccharide chain length determinant protein (PEP-CTERM system associated)
MDKQQSLILKKYIDLFFRWKLLIIILLLVSLPAGLIYYVKTPKVYMASSLLSYQQQKVSPNKMSPDVTAKIQDIVSTLNQIVTSRTNLEGLIKDFDLYQEQRERLPMEDVIDTMRKHINVQPSRRGDIFSISYSGGDPAKVVKVTNALAAKFIEENLKYREERASETSAYTSNELEMAKTTMDRKEEAMMDYKLKYYNEMADQRETNVSRLISLQEQYQSKQQNVLELERTRVLVQEQIATRKKILAAESSALAFETAQVSGSGTKSNTVETNYERLLRMRGLLDSLLVRYTENHPEVKRVRKVITKLEQSVQETGESSGNESGSPLGRGQRNTLAADRDTLMLQTQLKDISLNIAAIENERVQLEEKIKQYEEWVAATPVREAEWSALTREYSQLKSHYDYLVAQDLQAKSMLNLERRQKGSQFKVEDSARFPERPVKPNFIKTIGLFEGVALGAGAALILVISFLDGSFRDPEEIEQYLGVPVVSTIVHVQTAVEQKRSKIMNISILFIIFSASICVLGLFWYAWSRGKIVF